MTNSKQANKYKTFRDSFFFIVSVKSDFYGSLFFFASSRARADLHKQLAICVLSCGHLFVVMPYATADCHDRFGMLNSFPPEDNSLLMLHIFKWLAFIMSWIRKRSRLHFGYHVARAERLSTLFGIDGWKRWAKQQEKKNKQNLMSENSMLHKMLSIRQFLSFNWPSGRRLPAD